MDTSSLSLSTRVISTHTGSVERRPEADAAARPRILYLLTNEISSVLVRGQLDWVAAAGFDVHVGVGRDSAPTLHRWDRAAVVHDVGFTREISPWHDLRSLVSTIRLVRRLRPDIVNASTPKAGLLGTIAAWSCRVPTRLYVLRGLRFETTSGWKRRILIRLERVTTRCATHVFVNSPSARDVAVDAGLGRRRELEVIGHGSSNGVDVDHFGRAAAAAGARQTSRDEFEVDEAAIVVGFIGRPTNDKGFEDALAAFESLRRDRPGLHLLVVGDHDDGDAIGSGLRRRIADRPDVTTVPWVVDTATVYPAIDVVVFPSLREGLPNVPLQAQAAGVPVVGYAATGTVDALEDGVGGLLVSVGDRVGLEHALAAVVDDRDRRAALAAAGSTWVRQRFEQATFWRALTDRYRSWSSGSET